MAYIDHRLQRVWTSCPSSGQPIHTAAVMSSREFYLFDGALSLWCPHCKDAHSATKTQLWQERPAGKPWD